MESARSRLELTLHGRVQRVGYRAFAQWMACKLGITGYVKNNYDGGVSVVAEGKDCDLRTFLSELERGPAMAEVTDIVVSWRPYTGKYEGFNIRR